MAAPIPTPVPELIASDAQDAAIHPPRWRPRALCAFLCITYFCLCFYAFSAYHTFPAEWHPDEPGKAAQILSPTGERNFNHPELLLETTQLVTDWLHTPRDTQAIVEIGRRISAAFAALAIVAFALCGYLANKLWGFVLTGTTTALCPFLIAHSRYMKEDAALIFGIALVIFASNLFWNVRRRPSQLFGAAFLGIAVGLAMSAKYFGVISLALALPALLLKACGFWSRNRKIGVSPIPATTSNTGLEAARPSSNQFTTEHAETQSTQRFKRPLQTAKQQSSVPSAAAPTSRLFSVCSVSLCALWSSLRWFGPEPTSYDLPEARPSPFWLRLLNLFIFACLAIVVVLAVNHRVFNDYPRFREALAREIQHSRTEHRGLSMATPNTYFLEVARSQTFAYLLVLAALLPVQLLCVRYRGFDMLLLFFTALTTAVICFCAIAVSRYALPIVVLTFFIAGLSASHLLDLLPQAGIARHAAGLVLLSVIIASQFPASFDCTLQFRDDSRHELRQWILQHVPPGATIAEDSYAELTLPANQDIDDGLERRVRVRLEFFVPDLISLQTLKEGARHPFYIATCQLASERWLNPHAIPIPEMQEQFDAYKLWYQTLLAGKDAQLVWESKQNWDMQALTNPKIRLYRVQLNSIGNTDRIP